MPSWPQQAHHQIDEQEYLTELTPAQVRKIRIEEDMEEIAALRAQDHELGPLEIETAIPSAEPVDPPPKRKKYTSRGDLRRESQEDKDKAMKRQWELAKK